MAYYTNKKVWITGASAGIGRALALTLAKQGANLVLSSRKEASLIEVKKDCGDSVNVDILVLDLEDHEGIERVFYENQSLIQDVDILINNGGISQRSKVSETEFSVYKKLMDVNYLGAVQLSRLILPFFMRRQKGHFVVMSSVAGKFGVPYRSGYSAAKMALHGFFDSLRAEVSQSGIYVSIICPGFVKTDISKNAITGDGKSMKKWTKRRKKAWM